MRSLYDDTATMKTIFAKRAEVCSMEGWQKHMSQYMTVHELEHWQKGGKFTNKRWAIIGQRMYCKPE